MDRLIVNSSFMKSLISKFTIRKIKKSMDIDADIDLNYLNVQFDGDDIIIKVDGIIKMNKEDFVKIVMRES